MFNCFKKSLYFDLISLFHYCYVPPFDCTFFDSKFSFYLVIIHLPSAGHFSPFLSLLRYWKLLVSLFIAGFFCFPVGCLPRSTSCTTCYSPASLSFCSIINKHSVLQYSLQQGPLKICNMTDFELQVALSDAFAFFTGFFVDLMDCLSLSLDHSYQPVWLV